MVYKELHLKKIKILLRGIKNPNLFEDKEFQAKFSEMEVASNYIDFSMKFEDSEDNDNYSSS